MSTHPTVRLPLLPPIAGIACLFAVQFISFLEGRGLSSITLNLGDVTAAFLVGLVCGSVLYSPRFMRSMAALICTGLLTVLGAFLWATSAGGDDMRGLGACMTAGMLLPLLNRLFDTCQRPGLPLGMAFGLGDFFWLFLYVLPSPPDLKNMQGILLCLHAVGGLLTMLCLWQQRQETLEASPTATADTQPDGPGQLDFTNRVAYPGHVTRIDPLHHESLIYLTAVALAFFALNALIDITFYRVHEATFPVPAHVHLYIWVLYPLVGLYIDRHGASMPLLLLCLAGNLLSPISAAATEGRLMFWLVYLGGLGCRAAALIYLTMVFSKLRHRFPCPCAIVSLPYVCMFLTFWMAYEWIQNFPSTVSIVLLSFVLAASFSYVSSRVQYALTLSGIQMPARRERAQTTTAEPEPQAANLARFSVKYGISSREQDVLQLIVEGYNTSMMAADLHLSENTIKSHVRQLLRKTETRNRIALAALVHSETREAPPPA